MIVILTSLLFFSHLTNAAEEDVSLTEEIAKIRDPFQMPPIQIKSKTPLTLLEKFEVNQFTLTGILTGLERFKAILRTPDGKSHIVSERMKLGKREGVILKISPDSVLVREVVVNTLGEKENVDSVLKFQTEEELKASRLSTDSTDDPRKKANIN